MNSKTCASQLCRALRGPLAQRTLSHRLRQTTNLVHRWESGRRDIRWSEFLGLARSCGANPEGAVAQGLGIPLERAMETICHGPTGPFSRFQLSRWRRGQVDPSLAQVLTLIQQGPRLLPLVEGFVPAGSVAEVRALAEARAHWDPRDPVLHTLLLEVRRPTYLDEPHRTQTLAKVAGLDGDRVESGLLALEKWGRLRWNGRNYRPQADPGQPLILPCSQEGLKRAREALPTAFAQLKGLIHSAPGRKTSLVELHLAVRPVGDHEPL